MVQFAMVSKKRNLKRTCQDKSQKESHKKIAEDALRRNLRRGDKLSKKGLEDHRKRRSSKRR